MNRLQRGKKAAIKAARNSKFYAHRVGSAIFSGTRLVSLGANSHKTHPDNDCFTIHAEFSSLKKVPRDYKNLVMYVARLTRTDKVSFAKPCPACQEKIENAGIKRCYFTDYSGHLKELVF
tara:strand:+ start:476 stop:835 length:360 start_codon:yes stop_codon:yes gene_type:complete